MFQKRHYEFIADLIADFGYPAEQERIAQHFARAFDRTQPGFKPDLFLKRCQPDSVPTHKRHV